MGLVLIDTILFMIAIVAIMIIAAIPITLIDQVVFNGRLFKKFKLWANSKIRD